VKPVEALVEPGAQVQQLINVECVADFYASPTMRLHFSVQGAPRVVALPLPLFFSKFLEPVEMGAEQFFQRWKQLSQCVAGGGGRPSVR